MRILLVEDDIKLQENIKSVFVKEGFSIDSAFDGDEADTLVRINSYELIILDLGLPNIDGLQLLKKWRKLKKSFLVLILTARSSWHDKVAGLDMGADDYLSKPFIIKELLSRVRALLRRAAGQCDSDINAGSLKLSLVNKSLYLDDNLITLTAKEFSLIQYLILHVDKTISRDRLSGQIYDFNDEIESNTLDVFIRRLRKKIGAKRILTIRGFGYRLVSKQHD